MGFAEGIKSSVIKDHTGNYVDGACFFKTFLDVALGNFVVVGLVYLPCGGHVGNREDHYDRQENRKKERGDPVKGFSSLKCAVAFFVINTGLGIVLMFLVLLFGDFADLVLFNTLNGHASVENLATGSYPVKEIIQFLFHLNSPFFLYSRRHS